MLCIANDIYDAHDLTYAYYCSRKYLKGRFASAVNHTGRKDDIGSRYFLLGLHSYERLCDTPTVYREVSAVGYTTQNLK